MPINGSNSGLSSNPVPSINKKIVPHSSIHVVALRSNQHLTESSVKKLPEVKAWQAGKANNLTIICEPIV
jgi:hypothetical protein